MTSADPGRGPEPDGGGGALPAFTALGEVEVARGWAIWLTRADFVDPHGETFQRDVVRHPGAVAVVAVTAEHSVVLVRQYRPALDQWILEVPAGTRDVDGEPEEATARRELAEEAGYAAEGWDLLTRCANSPGFCDQRSAVFLATGLIRVPLGRQGTEERFMQLELVPLDRFDALVDDGSIIDSTTILGVGLARRRLDVTERP